MHARRCRGIALREQRMRGLAPELVVHAFPPFALPRRRRRRKLEVRERRAQVEAGAADDDRRPARGDDLVDRLVRESLVAPDRDVLVERHDADEAGRVVGSSSEDRDAGVERSRVRRDDLGVEALAQDARDRRLAARGRAVDRDDDAKRRRPAA